MEFLITSQEIVTLCLFRFKIEHKYIINIQQYILYSRNLYNDFSSKLYKKKPKKQKTKKNEKKNHERGKEKANNETYEITMPLK